MHGVEAQPRYLGAILEAHRRRASGDTRSLDDLIRQAGAVRPARGFAEALRLDGTRETGRAAVIAEIKRRSPSKGPLDEDLDPAELAAAYEAGGATCLSVLTDADFFGGSSRDLEEARSAVALPVLRKDFTVCLADVCDARIMGADAVLLIAAALPGSELRDAFALSTSIGLDVLVEVHDEDELERVAELEPDLVGINQRDLRTFEEDPERAGRLAARARYLLGRGCLLVAESAIRSGADAARAAGAGFDAVLVGEALVRSGSREAKVRELCLADPVAAVDGGRSWA